MQFLDVSDNNIHVINDQFTKELERANSVKRLVLDVTNNPLHCDCSHESLSFLRWLHSQHHVTLRDQQQLQFSGLGGQYSLSTITYTSQWLKCHHVEPIILAIVTSLVVGALVIVMILLVRYRYRLQYKVFTLQDRVTRTCRKQTDETLHSAYEYDAFISYSSDDRFWVHDVLMKTLEETYGFRTFIHYRDIQVGENLQEAIDEYICKSREFILVLSENFLASTWCQTEMEETYRETRRRRGKLAVIILGSKPRTISDPTARKILDKYNYLQWRTTDSAESARRDSRENAHQQKLFWAKLVHHLYGERHACTCFCLPVGPQALGYREVQDFAENDSDGEDESHVHEQRNDGDHDNIGLATLPLKHTEHPAEGSHPQSANTEHPTDVLLHQFAAQPYSTADVEV